jgi:hypothetical protein
MRDICLIPLDNRPICAEWPQHLADFAGLPLHVPPPTLLDSGTLKTPLNTQALCDWGDPQADWIVALDTVCYGGLIPSRVGLEPLETLQTRLARFLARLARPPQAFASILRIPHYNNAEEEPDYWATWGEALYNYSVNYAHAWPDTTPDVGAQAEIPHTVLADFLARRRRNFDLNRAFVQALSDGQLARLVLAQDDTGPTGLNVSEARQLSALLTGLAGHVQTGADEVATTMLARHVCPHTPVHTVITGNAQAMARFDGVAVAEVVARQLAACATVPGTDGLSLIVHGPGQHMGDFCAGITPDTPATQVAETLQAVANSPRPVLADVACANGGDPALLAGLIDHGLIHRLYGYAAWNTPGNTIGSALSMGLLRYYAEHAGTFNPAAFARALLVRLSDDGLYQGQLRQALKTQHATLPSPEALLAALHAAGLKALEAQTGARVSRAEFPCNRWFEVRLQCS